MGDAPRSSWPEFGAGCRWGERHGKNAGADFLFQVLFCFATFTSSCGKGLAQKRIMLPDDAAPASFQPSVAQPSVAMMAVAWCLFPLAMGGHEGGGL
jgi:hypothetical protein